jgi:hypothetical protein
MRHGQRGRLDGRRQPTQRPSTAMPTAAAWHRARMMTTALRNGALDPLRLTPRHVVVHGGTGCDAPRRQFGGVGTERWGPLNEKRNMGDLCDCDAPDAFRDVEHRDEAQLTLPQQKHSQMYLSIQHSTITPTPRDAHMPSSTSSMLARA